MGRATWWGVPEGGRGTAVGAGLQGHQDGRGVPPGGCVGVLHILVMPRRSYVAVLILMGLHELHRWPNAPYALHTPDTHPALHVGSL